MVLGIGIFFAGSARAAANVYYSVGQDNTTDRKTGSPTITITSGTATFSEAQTGNIGVGDRVTYNTSSIAYVSGKISQTQWTLVTATGGTPGDVSGQTVNSIKREYDSLFNAEAGAADANHINNTSLVAADVILNLPCYYDIGPDTIAVTIDGWTTDSTRYIKVYTPNNVTTEVNQSQRHNGKWNSAKYRIEVTDPTTVIYVREDYVRIEGLQIHLTTSAEYRHGIYTANFWSSSGDVRISGNIIKGNRSGVWNQAGVFVSQMTGTTKTSVFNNIIYDFGMGVWSYDNRDTAYVYVYNNTITDIEDIYNYQRGIWDHSGNRIVAVNNIVSDCGNTQAYDGTFRAGTDYNATDGTDDIGQGTHNRTQQTFSLFDAPNKDFHLSTTDAGARNFGTDLSSDPNFPFSTDIDSQSRSGLNWDIGADEATFNGPFTMEAWVKPRAIPASQAIIAKAEELRVATDANGKPLCQIKSNFTWQTAASSGDALVANQWAHVSCTYDQANLKIHVNGVEKGSQPLTVGVDNMTSNWKIGTDDSSDGIYGEWNGLVDDFRFYNYARAADELVEDFNAGHPAGGSPISSPFTDYNFDEGVSSSAYNKGSGGSIFNGTLQPGSGGSNTSATQMWSLDGVNGKAVELDGTDDKVDLPDVGY